MHQEMDQPLTFRQKFLRVLNSFLYILGEFYGKTLRDLPTLRSLIESFIEGWIDGRALPA